jgi:hypothetical protein
VITLKWKQTLLILAAILVLSVSIPVGATPPEGVTITLTALYSFQDFGNPTGTWHSEGAISTSNGNLDIVPVHFGAGWPHGKGFETAHATEVISDDSGSMTIRSQGHGFEFTPTYDEGIYGDFCADEYDEYFYGTGNWVILSGTGEYENLHGQGSATMLGCVDWGNGTMTTIGIYNGQVH